MRARKNIETNCGARALVGDGKGTYVVFEWGFRNYKWSED